MVKGVERIRPHLQLRLFYDSEVLPERKIHVHVTRAENCSMPEVARTNRQSGSQFLQALRENGVVSVKLPARSPNLNAYAERFVRTIKESCLERLILFGEGSVRRAASEFVVHYHCERNHQGLHNKLICPDPRLVHDGGEVKRRERLGGLLNYYYRMAA